MPRPKKPGVESKKRSRNGCWPCKARKVKCGEEKPRCNNCERQGETCDYSIRLNWEGRPKKDRIGTGLYASSTAFGSPYELTFLLEENAFSSTPKTYTRLHYARSRSPISPLRLSTQTTDPDLMWNMPQGPTSNEAVDGGLYFRSEMFTSLSYTHAQFQATVDARSHFASISDATSSRSAGLASVNATMPPPLPSSVDPVSKRQKYDFTADANVGSPTPYSPYPAMPLTPLPIGSEENVVQTSTSPQHPAQWPPDIRCVSVQLMIKDLPKKRSGPAGVEAEGGLQYPITDSALTTYGYDLGLPDIDTPRNNDYSAIAMLRPQRDMMGFGDNIPYGSAEPHGKDMAFESGGYYAKPVPIRISKSLEPLPPLLMENQMSLLYFHHFINHTARVLVNHDCERNPFREILPEMAVQDENIMNLLLAFSAAHRAHMLNHQEPSNRIAVWVQDVFPKLREALNDDPNTISDSTLAAVIMLASLEIICSGTFEGPVSWQNHLTMARQMIIQRGGPRGMGRRDRVAYFISRWFAYLDVIGSLSGNKNGTPLGSFYWSSENASADEDFEIDCLMGFTTRCIGSLARVSELAKRCEPQRIDEEGNVREGWTPSPAIIEEAVKIRRALEDGVLDRNIRKGCNHRSSTSSDSEGVWDATEIYATNELYHWAGLIHLYRRVLGKPAMDPEVQRAVREIVGLLYKIRRRSTAEACLIFPMFAAGCDAHDEGQREKIIDRLRNVEGFGLNHVPKISTLMKRVWDTGKPWESLVSGEFFG